MYRIHDHRFDVVRDILTRTISGVSVCGQIASVSPDGRQREQRLVEPVPFSTISLQPRADGITISVEPLESDRATLKEIRSCDRFNQGIATPPVQPIILVQTKVRPEFQSYFGGAFRPEVHLHRQFIGSDVDRAIQQLSREAGDDGLIDTAIQVLNGALRAYISGAAPLRPGWIAGLADQHVAHVLQEMHSSPKRRWKMPELAMALGLDASNLAKHFTRIVGKSPINYLVDWKVRLCATEILQEGRKVGDVARDFGYANHNVFTAAFSRVFGCAPTAYKTARG